MIGDRQREVIIQNKNVTTKLKLPKIKSVTTKLKRRKHIDIRR